VESEETKLGRVPWKILAWAFAVFVAAICVETGYALFRSTVIFRTLFQDLGLDLPIATKLLVSNCVWIYPLLFGGGAIFLIAKEFMIAEPKRRLVTSGIVVVVAWALAGSAHYLLNLPMLGLVEKLSTTK
jgi:hypothetical protein